MATALGRLDALGFAAGIGENAAAIRDRVVREATWLGSFQAHVIPTNEELMMADYTRHVLGLNGANG